MQVGSVSSDALSKSPGMYSQINFVYLGLGMKWSNHSMIKGSLSEGGLVLLSLNWTILNQEVKIYQYHV